MSSADATPDTRATVVEAAARLLRDRGAAGVTTRAVAQAAGVPPPTIFRLFGDKDGLLDAVAEHVMATYVAATSETASREDGDPVGQLRDAWRTHVDFGLANPDLFVLLSSPGRSAPSPAAAAGRSVLQERVARVAAAGLLRLPEARAVELVHAAGTGAVLALLQQPLATRDTSLAETMLEAVLQAVVSAEPAPPASGLAPLAIAFRTAVPDLPDLTDAERALLTEWTGRVITRLTD